MQFRAEVAIQADPLEVWRTLVDFSSYHEWNPFITRIEGNLVAGAKFSTEFSLPERGELRFKPELVQCEPPQRLRWKGRLMFLGLVEIAHFIEIHPAEEGRTRLVHGADFSGPLLKYSGDTLKHLARGFVYMNQALKKRLEEAPA